MRKIYTIFFAATVLFLSSDLKAQQQSIYTNYLFNLYGYNPAVAGSLSYMQGNIYYRNQWSGFEGAPKTYLASMYSSLKKHKQMGIGGMVMSDKTGLLGRTSAHASYAYHVKVNSNTKLGAGISAGFVQYNVKVYDVKAYDAGDYMLTGNILAGNAMDMNIGLYLYNPKYFVSMSSQQMLGNKIKWASPYGRLSRQFNLIVGYNYKVDKDFTIQPSFLFKSIQRNLKSSDVSATQTAKGSPPPSQLDVSLKFIYKDMVSFAASLRTEKFFNKNDALVFLIEYKAVKKITVGYSYDLSLNTIRKYNSGSHELYLGYSFIKKKKVDIEEEQFKVIDNSVKGNIKNKKEEKK